MVTTLPACGKHQVVSDEVTPTKPIVGVDSSTRAVEKHVSGHNRQSGLGLNEKRRLFLVEANLSSCVAHHRREPRMLTVRAVHTCVWSVGQRHPRSSSVSVGLVRVPS